METKQKDSALSQSKDVVLRLSKGFTLLELLIVIAILAILSTIAVLVINPAEYLRQARDAQRIADFITLKKSVDLYMSGTSTPFVAANCAPTRAYVTSGTTNPWSPTTTVTTLASSTATAINGAGWLGAINFTTMTGGSPLAKLPVDPVNNGTLFYSFVCNATASTYEMDVAMESSKYASMESSVKDGGNNESYYEIGNVLSF